MSQLAEFLKDRAEQLRADAPRREATVREWVEALNRLLGQMREWIRESDPERLLVVRDRNVTLREVGLGAYEAPALEISLGSDTVQVTPVARNNVGRRTPREGVELRVQGRVRVSDGTYDETLFRLIEGDESRWYVPILPLTNGVDVWPFDRERFEQLLVSIFK